MNPALDSALANWTLQCQHQKLAVTDEIIKKNGKELAALLNVPISFSNGWLQSFCSRHSFRHFKIHGESGSAPVEGYKEQLARIKDL